MPGGGRTENRPTKPGSALRGRTVTQRIAAASTIAIAAQGAHRQATRAEAWAGLASANCSLIHCSSRGCRGRFANAQRDPFARPV